MKTGQQHGSPHQLKSFKYFDSDPTNRLKKVASLTRKAKQRGQDTTWQEKNMAKQKKTEERNSWKKHRNVKQNKKKEKHEEATPEWEKIIIIQTQTIPEQQIN